MSTEKVGKWPASITAIRHDISHYNNLAVRKSEDPEYIEFKRLFNRFQKRVNKEHFPLDAPQDLYDAAHCMAQKYRLPYSDSDTPVLEGLSERMIKTGNALKDNYPLPDVVLVSPYLRTEETYDGLCAGWGELKNVKKISEIRLREKDHGLQTLYSDWRIFQALHPEQILYYKRKGMYDFTSPQGENTYDVQERIRSLITTLIREYAGKHVLCVSHHLCILSICAQLLRWDREKFIHYDETNKPENCSVTRFESQPNEGSDGRIYMTEYGKLYF